MYWEIMIVIMIYLGKHTKWMERLIKINMLKDINCSVNIFINHFSEKSILWIQKYSISPPDVKIETTFFQRNFFSTIPCNYPQKQHKKRTSDLSEVPILRCFLKILPLSASLPASYQIPPDCTPNGIFPSNDTSFPHPIRTFSISFAALAHY